MVVIAPLSTLRLLEAAVVRGAVGFGVLDRSDPEHAVQRGGWHQDAPTEPDGWYVSGRRGVVGGPAADTEESSGLLDDVDQSDPTVAEYLRSGWPPYAAAPTSGGHAMSVFRRCSRDGCGARLAANAGRCGKCGSDRWSWAFKVDAGRHPNGRRREKRGGGFKTKREAERAQRELLATLDEGRYVARSRLTLATYLRDQWLPSTAPPKVAHKTWRERRDTFERYVVPSVGSVELQKLNPAHLTGLYAELLREGGKGGVPLSPTSATFTAGCRRRSPTRCAGDSSSATRPTSPTHPRRKASRPLADAQCAHGRSTSCAPFSARPPATRCTPCGSLRP